jgi:hypothetical protein
MGSGRTYITIIEVSGHDGPLHHCLRRPWPAMLGCSRRIGLPKAFLQPPWVHQFARNRPAVGRLREQMLRPYVVGGPTEDRHWTVPAYGLGTMCGENRDGHRAVGHTCGGPGSVIAVYRRMESLSLGSSAAFLLGDINGQVEQVAFELAAV